MRDIILTAHTGCDGTKPNSIEYINHVNTLDVDCIEVDVREYDGKLVISHDPVKDGDSCIFLEEVLSILNLDNKKINFDIKTKGLAIKVVKLVKSMNKFIDYVFSGCISIEDLENENIENERILLNPDIIYNDLYNNGCRDEDFILFINKVKELNIKNINLYYKCVNKDRVLLAKQFGIETYVWTVDDEDDLMNILNIGLKGVTTNRVIDFKDLIKKDNI